jgi:tetratricopeptide (TPR) repeat protein
LTVPVALICLAAVIMLSLGARFIVADKKALAGGRSNVAEGMLLLRQAFELNPAEAEYRFVAGSILHEAAIVSRQASPETRLQLFQETKRQYLEALRKRPRSVLYLLAVARIDSAWGQLLDMQHFVTAGESWRRLLAIDPNNFRWHLQYSDMLRSSSEADNNNRQLRMAQIAELRKSLAIYDDQPVAWNLLADAYAAIGETEQADAIRVKLAAASPSGNPPSTGANAPTAAAASAPSNLGPAVGLALAFLVPLLAGVAWFRRMFLGTVSREKRKVNKKEVVPNRLQELIGATGVWSLAVAVPYAGALLGAGRAPGEMRELILHLIPGIAALVLAFVYASTPYQSRPDTGALTTFAPFATFVMSLIAVIVHVPEMIAAEDPQAVGRVLMHLAPLLAMFVLVAFSISQRPATVAPAPRAAKESVDIV